MILKYGDKNTGWSWLSSIQEVTEVDSDNIPDDARYVGEETGAQCYEVTFNNGESEFMVLGVGEIYLCNEETGSTVDVLKSGKR
jgi:hypothetical protein